MSSWYPSLVPPAPIPLTAPADQPPPDYAIRAAGHSNRDAGNIPASTDPTHYLVSGIGHMRLKAGGAMLKL